MTKPNKSILKRITITKSGRLLRRKAGQNHFNAKESRRVQRWKKATLSLSPAFEKALRQRIAL